MVFGAQIQKIYVSRKHTVCAYLHRSVFKFYIYLRQNKQRLKIRNLNRYILKFSQNLIFKLYYDDDASLNLEMEFYFLNCTFKFGSGVPARHGAGGSVKVTSAGMERWLILFFSRALFNSIACSCMCLRHEYGLTYDSLDLFCPKRFIFSLTICFGFGLSLTLMNVVICYRKFFFNCKLIKTYIKCGELTYCIAMLHCSALVFMCPFNLKHWYNMVTTFSIIDF